ncbi:uncharacterized protein LOC142616264 [Castanea sativa]|uniref:uncharacterized protein LOC142616264 n=1 Tax=Castanea sativa TaxID=21020 RepID=UPI003F65348B
MAKNRHTKNDDIVVSKKDAKQIKQPHDDPLVIMLAIEGCNTRRVLVDNGSSADVMYMTVFKQMKLDPKCLKPFKSPTGEIIGDQLLARECYQAVLASRENHTWMVEEEPPKPMEKAKNVVLVEGNPSKTTKVGKELQQTLKDKLVRFLKKNLDIFAWSHKDMPGIDRQVIEHSLNVDPIKKPVQQKRRVFALERNKAIMEEVEKLLTAGFIREVYHLKWFANVVKVKKSNGKWRMCVDFTDLNNAYPKDSFPLPRIDQLVDSTAGHELLTFMDAFSGIQHERYRSKLLASSAMYLSPYLISVVLTRKRPAMYFEIYMKESAVTTREQDL